MPEPARAAGIDSVPAADAVRDVVMRSMTSVASNGDICVTLMSVPVPEFDPTAAEAKGGSASVSGPVARGTVVWGGWSCRPTSANSCQLTYAMAFDPQLTATGDTATAVMEAIRRAQCS